jgi:peptide/nickel transport system permease protein/nickel transport system permease protein
VDAFMKIGTRRFILKKILELFLTLFIVTIISFILMRAAPIGPAESYARRGAITDPVKIAEIKEKMGLTRPLAEQYIDWVKHVIRLDFGKSYVSNRDVFTDVMTALLVR